MDSFVSVMTSHVTAHSLVLCVVDMATVIVDAVNATQVGLVMLVTVWLK